MGEGEGEEARARVIAGVQGSFRNGRDFRPRGHTKSRPRLLKSPGSPFTVEGKKLLSVD